ncbi:MAG: hypothetical protein E7016_02205 [Alphaproteobacteria bacterium]|nr:hypothetical protein [Alphaproteobacteria bacterium]
MRKYFLLSAVALLAATSANATTDYAEVTARATIEVAGTFSCTDLDFGTLVFKQGNEAFNYGVDGYFGTGTYTHKDLISASNISFNCELPLGIYNAAITDITLKNENSDELTLNLLLGMANSFWYEPFLEIPANIQPGTYTGTFTITLTY